MIEIPDKYIINPEYVKALEWDIDAYRAALGYPVPGNHTGRLTDGTIPRCGICEAHRAREMGTLFQSKDPVNIRDRETISSDTADKPREEWECKANQIPG